VLLTKAISCFQDIIFDKLISKLEAHISLY